MSTEKTDPTIDRRTYVKGAAAFGVLGTSTLAGCTDDGDGADDSDDGSTDDDGDGADDSDDGTGDGPEAGAFEIVHWWTAGGEEEALDALLEGFLEETGYDEEVIDNNPAPGGAGAAIDAAIQSRVIDEDPPSTFQIWPGESLRPYTDAGVLASVEDLWSDEQQDAYRGDVIDLASPEGDLVAVPINIHRMNNIFYNVDVVEDAGVDVEDVSDPDAFLDVLADVDDAGYTGLAHQTSSEWSTLQMWESLFIGQHGVDAYQTFLDREMESVESEIQETLELVVDYRDYFSGDASAITWDEGADQVVTGDAAFIHQGDWAAAELDGSDLEYGEGWDYIPVPGTEDVYHVVMDSFVKPEPNPSSEITDEFLAYCGTVDAQERFNTNKGSIPPRTDVDMSDFPPFLQDQMDDFEGSSAQPPTVAHGSGFDPEGKSELEEIFAAFIEDWDASAAADRIVSDL